MTEIKELSFSDIQQILTSGDFELFLGAKEGATFEAKLFKCFDLTKGASTNSKIAQYVASFANNNGGYIICGLNAPGEVNVPHDIVLSLDLGPKEDFPVNSLVARAQQSIFPRIDIQAAWYPSKKDSLRGLGVIHIPKQEESKKHFYIRIREIEGEVLKHELFGIPIRTNDSTDWVKVDRLHEKSKTIPSDLIKAYNGLSSQIEGMRAEIITKLGNSTGASDKTDEGGRLIGKIRRIQIDE